MSQLALDLPQHKNGHAGHGRHERDLAADLTHWIADLDAPKPWAASSYTKSPNCDPKSTGTPTRGMTPAILRATRKLMRK
jgi:hypothetical protein